MSSARKNQPVFAARLPKGAYEVKQYNLSGLTGISDRTLELHFTLYEGYVKETNRLTERIADFLHDGKVNEPPGSAARAVTARTMTT